MADRYVRKSGSDANGGTSPADAWLTFAKAMGATGITAGDHVYIGAGTYRETPAIGWTNNGAVQTQFIGDVDGSKTGDAGDVVWTAYVTNDKTAPVAATALCNLGGRDNILFQNLVMVGGTLAGAQIHAQNTSSDLTYRRCTFLPGAGTTCFNGATLTTPHNHLYDQCDFLYPGLAYAGQPPTVAGADYDINVVFQNCRFFGGSKVWFGPTGALAGKPGGVDVLNCTFIGMVTPFTTANANCSTSIPCTIYNSFCLGATSALLNAFALGHIVEDHNVLLSTVPRANVAAGANSVAGSPFPYAPMFEAAQALFTGRRLRPFGVPTVGSPLLGFGSQAGAPTTDMLGLPRPFGSASALYAVGAFERGDTATKETATVRTGANALKLTGPGCQDFELPVDAAAITVNVYGRYDGVYAGTLPQLRVLGGAEAGVADATATMAGAANAWELLSLTFTPTAAGIVTVRLQSSDTNGGGAAFFDDLAAA